MPGAALSALALVPPLHLTLASTPDAVRAALVRVGSALAEAGLRPGTCGMVELVIAESLNNIAEHAYRGTGTGEIVLRLVHLSGAIEVTLIDSGQPYPEGALPKAGTFPALTGGRATLPEGGFGWCLIRRLTSKLIYTRKNGRNRLFLRMDLDCLA